MAEIDHNNNNLPDDLASLGVPPSFFVSEFQVSKVDDVLQRATLIYEVFAFPSVHEGAFELEYESSITVPLILLEQNREQEIVERYIAPKEIKHLHLQVH